MRGWRNKEKGLIVGSCFTFFFIFVFHPSKACVYPLDGHLLRPLAAIAGDGTVYYDKHPEDWCLSWALGKLDLSLWSVLATSWVTLLKSSGPSRSINDLVLLTTFSPQTQNSLAWLYLPSLSMAHRFLNSALRSAQWFGSTNSSGLGPLSKKVSLSLWRTWDILYSSYGPSPILPYLPSKAQCFQGHAKSWVHQETSSKLLKVFPLSSRVIHVYVSLTCSPSTVGSSQEGSTLLCHIP